MTLTSISVWAAQLGGLGRSPYAPGTVAAAVAGIPAAIILSYVPNPWAVIFLAALFFVACFVSDKAESELDKRDPNEIVIDELVGFLITMLGLTISIKSLLLGFLAFRLFDIWKPWPINLLNKEIPGGFWIVADDVGAGYYAHALVWLILQLWP
jgi:phosphatidylglycerophosphatase A